MHHSYFFHTFLTKAATDLSGSDLEVQVLGCWVYCVVDAEGLKTESEVERNEVKPS